MRKFTTIIVGFYYILIAVIFLFVIGITILYRFGKFTWRFFYKKFKGADFEEDEEDD